MVARSLKPLMKIMMDHPLDMLSQVLIVAVITVIANTLGT